MSTTTKPRTLKIRATTDFRVGPAHEIVIPKGSTRQIADPGERGPFWTTDKRGALFGLCRLGQGWEVVK